MMRASRSRRRAVAAGIDVGDVAADRTVGDALLDRPHRVDERVDFFARRLQEVKREPLRAAGADARQALQGRDQIGQRIGTRHQDNPGIFIPPIMPCI